MTDVYKRQEVLRALLDDTFTVEEQPRANLAAYAQLKSGGGPFQLLSLIHILGQRRWRRAAEQVCRVRGRRYRH